MDYNLTIFILALVLNIGIGLIVYLNNPKGRLNALFAFMVFWLVAWITISFIEEEPINEKIISLLVKIDFALAILLTYSFFIFCRGFPIKRLFKKVNEFLLFLPCAFFIIFSFSNLVVHHIEFHPGWIYLAPGQLYFLYTLFIFSYIGVGIIDLFIKHKKLKGVQKIQTRYVLWGLLLSALIILITNIILPNVLKIPSPPIVSRIGIYSTIIFVAFTAFAIVKHHLLGIRVILTETLVAAIGLILLVQATLAKGLWDIIFRVGILVLFSYFGYLLIKAVIREIERRREVEKLAKELKTANLQLKQFDEAKSNFVNIVSHQLRTPVSIMRGHSSMLLEGDYGELTDEQKRVAREDLESAIRLSDFIDTFLNITKIEVGRLELRKEWTDMEELIREVAKEIKPLTEKKKLYLKVISPKASLPAVEVDRGYIRQVVMNLIDNGIKYTEKGGITVTMEQVNNEEQFHVKDTGMGIPLKEVSLLYQKFSRGKRAVINPDGSGLGLFIVKQFVELHGGRAWVESEGKGKGSTFSFSLPIIEKKK